jgi:NADH-quinone oxidoreductase subunit E
VTWETEEEIAVRVAGVLAEYDSDRTKLIPILQRIQESLGYIPGRAMLEVAARLGIPAVDVYGVATFYNQFRLHPPARHQVRVCMGTACHMKGGSIILEHWERRLAIRVGQTTPDREFGLERVACVGCCTLAPVTVVDDTVHGKMTPTKVDGLLFAFGLARREGEAP